MDEPTNDLDVETLELLEEQVAEFPGTLVLVSHDRQFLDNVVTSTLVFEGEGRIGEYVGGYSDWLRQRAVAAPARPAGKAPASPPAKRETPANRPAKLSYKEQRELESLPARIEELEAEQSALTGRVASADFYQQDKDRIQATLARLDAVGAELEQCYASWEALEARGR